MKTRIKHTFPIEPQALLALYSSREFYEDRFKADGIENYTITRFEENGRETIIEIEQDIEIKTEKLPRFMRKIVGNLAGDSTTVTTQTVWDKQKHTGSHRINTSGIPINVNISFELSEAAKDSCINQVNLEIKAKIPIVGKQLEKFMLPKAEKSLKRDLEKTAEYIAANA